MHHKTTHKSICQAHHPSIAKPKALGEKQIKPVLLFDIGNVFLLLDRASNKTDQIRENKPLIELLLKLKKSGYIAIAVTDASACQVHLEMSQFAFYQQFSDVIIAEQCGMSKVNANLYEHILNIHQLFHHECLFIDDRIEHLKAANAVNIQTIHFTTTENLLRELNHLNVNCMA